MSEGLHRRIERMRKEMGMSRSALAGAVTGDRDPSPIFEWEAGRGVPDAGDLLRLAEVFGVDPHALWHGQGCSAGDDPGLAGLAFEARRVIISVAWDNAIPRSERIELLSDCLDLLRGDEVRRGRWKHRLRRHPGAARSGAAPAHEGQDRPGQRPAVGKTIR